MDRSLVDHLPQHCPEPEEVREVAMLAGLEGTLEIVDVGANPIGGRPPYQPLLSAGVARVTGFEPQPKALADLLEAASESERYLPHVIGDGENHTLYQCASDGFTSLLPPDAAQLGLLTDFPDLAAVTATEQVSTIRLDDVPGLERIDLLKMDIQGGELMVIRHGQRLLAGAGAIQTEVGFHRLYAGAPTFADVDLALRELGFVPTRFVSTRTWPLSPVAWADPLERDARHLVEADLLYVVDPARVGSVETTRLQRLAVVAYGAYSAAGITLRCLTELEARAVVAPGSASRFAELARSHQG